MHISRKQCYILLVLLITEFVVSLVVYSFSPVFFGGITVHARNVPESLLLSGRDGDSLSGRLTELPPGMSININTASAEMLTSLPGIGEKLAGEIVNYREIHGPFGSIDEITSVSGIGEVRFAAIESYISVEELEK